MSMIGTVDERGIVEHVEQVENESSNIRGGGGDSRTDSDRSPRRAFSKRGVSHGGSRGSDSGSESLGDIDTSGSHQSSQGDHERVDVTDRSGEERERTSTGDVVGGGESESRRGGSLYGIDPRRPGETQQQYINRYKRERRAAIKRIERGDTETQRDSARVQVDSIEEEQPSFTLTVEEAAGGETLAAKPSQEKKAAPRSKKGSKYKEPNKDNVALLASSLQDIYSLTDGGISLASILMDKFYIPGTFELEPDKAEKMAHALARMNVSTPKLAEYINKYSAPMTFFSVMVMDLVSKGVMIRGMWQQPNSKTHI